MKTTRLSLFFVLILLVQSALAATIQCNMLVNDQTGALGSKFPMVEQAANNLNAKGADARILVIGLSGYPTMDALVMDVVKNCPSWQSPNHGVKSTLVVLAVAPRERKMGIYTGHAYDSAFGSARMNRYRADFMAPHFKAGEWAEGLIATAGQMASRLEAYTAEVNSPVVNNTVNQASAPTDFHGLWVFLWIVGFLGIVGISWWIAAARRKAKEQLLEAQQSAIAARNRAANLLSELTLSLSQYNNIFAGKPGAARASQILESASSQYSDLSRNLSGDPTQDGLGVASYASLRSQFASIADRLDAAKDYLSHPSDEPEVGGYQPYSHSSSSDPRYFVPRRRYETDKPSRPIQHHTKETVIVHDGSSELLTGVLIGESLNRQPPPEYHPTPAKEPDPEPDTFSSDSGSSSFSSDSSSSSDFGSSSSFDSGSSDFGGGSGGSDF